MATILFFSSLGSPIGMLPSMRKTLLSGILGIPLLRSRTNLTRLSPRDMKNIRECVLVIRLPPKVGWAGSAPSRYVEYRACIADFANVFGENQHSLQRMAISFNQPGVKQATRTDPTAHHVVLDFAKIYWSRSRPFTVWRTQKTPRR